jgi:hypothetical protein|tara:strand:- start:612 stop:800 length:189 start_codon:yes stop_codon:yes gene_type:complete
MYFHSQLVSFCAACPAEEGGDEKDVTLFSVQTDGVQAQSKPKTNAPKHDQIHEKALTQLPCV